MATGTHDAAHDQPFPFGGARADFVAALGRRVAELRAALSGWEKDSSSRARDDLRRRLHALGVRARLLRFAALAEKLEHCERRVSQGAEGAGVQVEEAQELRRAFDDLPALAWGHTSLGPPSSDASPDTAMRASDSAAPRFFGPPANVLVVGPVALVHTLRAGCEASRADEQTLEIERCDDPRVAQELARAFAPDVLLLDADVPGAIDLVKRLLEDPFTEPVRVIVVGRWSESESGANGTAPRSGTWASFGVSSAPFVSLGVASVLRKPVLPAMLRRACLEALRAKAGDAAAPIGVSSVEDLATRLADELRKGICGAADAHSRGVQIDFERGSDVLAPVWGAVARVRDIVANRSHGAVHFAPEVPEAGPAGPDGLVIADKSRGDDVALGGGAAARVIDAGGERRPIDGVLGLRGTSVLVADDDPAVTWFLAGVLRAAGAAVHEVHDGARALHVAYETQPDLAIIDLIMPRLDGFALCRTMKRDVVLRDVPVLLLSWKEDLLQRVREIGADADGYLRKEASAAAIVQRAREVLRPRHRVAHRLEAPGEVRGRLDGMTAATLLRLVSAKRPEATLWVRDARSAYEIRIEHGRPTHVQRTSISGEIDRGAAALRALLGVGAGRFTVTPAGAPSEPGAEPTSHAPSDSLETQLAPLVASARAAQRLVSGGELGRVRRVVFTDAQLKTYLEATPVPVQLILRKLAEGASPGELIAGGDSASVVEDVLCDAAIRGAIGAIFDGEGRELLAIATEQERTRLAGGAHGPPILLAATAASVVEPDLRDEGAAPRADVESPLAVEGDERHADDRDSEDDDLEPVVEVQRGAASSAPSSGPTPSDAPVPFAQPQSQPQLQLRPRLQLQLQPPAGPEDIEEIEPLDELSPEPAAALEVSCEPLDEPIPFLPRRSRAWTAMGIALGLGALAALVSTFVSSIEPGGSGVESISITEMKPLAAPPEPPRVEAPHVAQAAAAQPELETDLPLDPADSILPGQGRLEIFAHPEETVMVDGRAVGHGPRVCVALTTRINPYEIRLKQRSLERVRFVSIKAGRLVRYRASPP